MLSLAHYGLFHDENTWTFGSGGTSAERWRDFARSLGRMVTVFFCVGGGLGWEMKTNSSPKNMCGECILGLDFLVCYIGPKLMKALKKWMVKASFWEGSFSRAFWFV